MSANIEFDDSEYDYKTLNLMEFLKHSTPSGWTDFFSQSNVQEILQDSSDELLKLGERETIYPSMENIFRAFYLVPLNEIKIVILGQDPFFNGSAVGLAFSVKKGNAINPSLRNIQQEVSSCGFDVDKKQGDLTQWAKQGVFLINTALTVKEGSAGSHLKVWSKFTQELIKYITDKRDDLVFILWGEKAQAYKKYFSKDQFTVETSHPSPLSASRGFLGSQCFVEANSYLLAANKDEVDWSIL